MDTTKIVLLIFVSLLLGVFTLYLVEKPPVVEKISGPSGVITQRMSKFVWEANDPDGKVKRMEYRKDGGRWKTFGESDTYVWPGYTEGEHTFEVRARDNNGKPSEIVQWTFTYNPNPLSKIDLKSPFGRIDISTSVFDWKNEFPLEKVQIFEYKKDDGKWTDCGTATTYIWDNYSVGNHTFKVRAKTKDEEYTSVYTWSFEYSQEPVGGEMVLVEAGSFTMSESLDNSSESDSTVITLTNDFYMGKYEVTYKEYIQFCNETGIKLPLKNSWGSNEIPVLKISWWEAVTYCNWLSKKKGLPVAYDKNGNLVDKYGNITDDLSEVVGFRLPTEPEWVFAAKGGKTSNGYIYSGSNNPDEVAWYSQNSYGAPHKVGLKKPNELGIYDMSGNVNEWCNSWYKEYHSNTETLDNTKGIYRITRGGNWNSSRTYIRINNYDAFPPDDTNITFGFRVCRTAQ
ncbi:MAG: formylglycine-generating enzyme family protein [Kosmotoga sp.]|nr:MAG: formylglycine-generating enzyme family protein [Kosmotoga sp.]